MTFETARKQRHMYTNRLRGILLQFGGLVNRRELQVYRERLLAQNLHEHPVELAANDASRLDRYSPMTPRLTLKPLLKPRSKRSNWPGRGLSSSRGGCVSSFVYYSLSVCAQPLRPLMERKVFNIK